MKTSSAVARRQVLLLLVCQILGCGADLTGPNRGNPAQYAFASPVEYGCGRWSPAQPTVSLGLFDIVNQRIGTSDPDAAPTDAELSALVHAGATVVHSFQVNMVRVILPPTAVAALNPILVTGVRDPAQYGVEVLVAFRGTPDPQLITQAGGQVLQVLVSLNFIYAVVPDRVIPSLRASSIVLFVEGPSLGCTA